MKTAIIFFAVIICSTFVTARLGSRNLATSYTTQDFNEFTRGLWDSLALAHEYEDFQNCIHQQAPAGILLIKAIASLDQFTEKDVVIGLKRFGKVFNVIIAALKQCDSKEMYWGTFSEIVGNFTQPASMSLTQGSSFTIDGVEVYSDIVRAVAACSNSQMATCGDAIGDAMGKVYYGQVDPTSPETIAKINSIPNLTWTAGVNPDFQRMNLWQFKKDRVSLRHMHSKKKNKTNSTTSDDTTGRGRQLQSMPASFDTRTRWPYCIHAIQDQGPCASCWAVASAEVLSDRFCIASGRAVNTVLGPQYMVSCDTSNKGCNGGYLKNVWNFLETYGDVTETCFPYTSANFVIPTCSSFTRCRDNTVMRKYYAKKGSSRSFSGVAAMQQEIYANGPIVAAMFVYSDFMSYTSGIYKQAWGSYLGGHAIKIIGWGTQNGVGYWIISNSWGKSWGETGHARIAFGQVGMENQGYAGLADLVRK